MCENIKLFNVLEYCHFIIQCILIYPNKDKQLKIKLVMSKFVFQFWLTVRKNSRITQRISLGKYHFNLFTIKKLNLFPIQELNLHRSTPEPLFFMFSSGVEPLTFGS